LLVADVFEIELGDLDTHHLHWQKQICGTRK